MDNAAARKEDAEANAQTLKAIQQTVALASQVPSALDEQTNKIIAALDGHKNVGCHALASFVSTLLICNFRPQWTRLKILRSSRRGAKFKKPSGLTQARVLQLVSTHPS